MGFAVMRFDFTGLGQSEGRFAQTDFTSNVDDLIAASDYLTERNLTPSLLIGHSLGGAAVLKAAALLAQIKGVVTLGAPFDPAHVTHRHSRYNRKRFHRSDPWWAALYDWQTVR